MHLVGINRWVGSAPTTLDAPPMFSVHPDITLGRRLRRTALDGMAVNEVLYPAGLRFRPHAHEHANISILLAGDFHERSGNVATECKTCSVVFKPPRTVHANEVGARGARSLIIEIQPDTFDRLCRWSPAMRQYAWVHDGPVPELMVRIYREFRLDDDLSGSSLEQLLTEVLAADHPFHNHHGGKPRWLGDLTEALHDEPDCVPRVPELAEAAGVHPVYLARAFRRRHRCTIAQYVRRLRLQRATHDLSSTVKTLATIALDAGFADQAHFCRSFKAHACLTPGQFRRFASA